MSVTIHPTALVDKGAMLGEGVVVGPYCIIEKDVVIGDGTTIDAYAQIKSFTRIGKNNRIHSYAFIGCEPQHLSYKGEETYVHVGDSNTIREFVTIHRGTASGLGHSKIGSHCMLMAYVHVAHDCELGDGVIMANASSLAGHVHIGDHSIISGMSGVHQFVRIGEYAFLGAMGGFGQDIPPYTLATGVRAKLHGLNLIGLRRNKVPAATIKALKSAYQKIWRSETPRDEALDNVEATFADIPEVMRLVAFIRSSERGVTPHTNSRIDDNA